VIPGSPGPRTLPQLLREHERVLLLTALQRCGYSRARAAAALGVSCRDFYRRVRRLGIDLRSLPVRSRGVDNCRLKW
jgi:DNA-binding NtrC family response regulator